MSFTKADIDRQLKQGADLFYSQKYEFDLPENLLEVFKRALFVTPPAVHKYQSSYTSALLAVKSVKDLTILNVGHIMNLIMACRPIDVHDTIEEAIEWIGIAEAVSLDYSKLTVPFEKSQRKKEESLMQLANKTTIFKP